MGRTSPYPKRPQNILALTWPYPVAKSLNYKNRNVSFPPPTNQTLHISYKEHEKFKCKMASVAALQTLLPVVSSKRPAVTGLPSLSTFSVRPAQLVFTVSRSRNEKKRSLTVVAAVGDVSADGTAYLIGGAVAVALLGTAFPILFSRKDLCPECDGAGFVRKAGVTLRANAARKDQAQIVCARCNGLGKLGQIDK
ncbi:hypothetical protein HHK36_019482 [Tetracentron sinense]|uniref:Uncharacterized protein n=1 Tax=Tetracentron sinense TaxID=13715 RepID=A0A834YTY6_TETSI|nr:hypothetical protein HHK36_019482 [Tetracentron sinense]